MSRSNLWKRKNRQAIILKICGLLFLCFAMFSITGCPGESLFNWYADDDSYEARIEEAIIALDDEDYSKALNILEDLEEDYPDDSLVLQYLSNACAGMAGIDTFNFLEVIDQLIDKDQAGRIDMVGLVLGGHDARLSGEEIDTKIELLGDCAILKLLSIDDPNDNQIVQLGLVSLFHAALTIADIVMDDLPTIDSIVLTEEGLNSLYGPGNLADFSGIDITDRLDDLSDDIARIDESIYTILEMLDLDSPEENDISESFNEFSQDIDPDGDGVSQDNLQNYINGL
jgi:hypothetical protein